MSKELTALEYLLDKLPLSITTQYDRCIEIAKEMEKQQIIEAAIWMPKPFEELEFLPELGEQYYNEKFKKE